VLMQALRGQSVLVPDAVTLTLLATWLLTTAAAMAAAVTVHSGWLFDVKPGKIAGA
jgi:hypothetical protein